MGRAEFGPDHFVAALRGYKRPKSSSVRRHLASRAAWLAAKVRRYTSLDPDCRSAAIMLEELAAIVVAMEVYEEAFPRGETGKHVAVAASMWEDDAI